MKEELEEETCGTCCHFYDEWSDGTGKCGKAFGAITTADNTCKCHQFPIYVPELDEEYDYYCEDD